MSYLGYNVDLQTVTDEVPDIAGTRVLTAIYAGHLCALESQVFVICTNKTSIKYLLAAV